MTRLNPTSFQPGNVPAVTSTERERLVWEAFRAIDRNTFVNLINDYYPLLLNYGSQFQKDREFVKDYLHTLS